MDIRLETLVHENYKNLNESDKYIWNYILKNKKECEKMSIQKLASNCNVSHTTVLRFSQKLGLNGYSELKFYLKLGNKTKKKVTCKPDYIKIRDDINKTIDVLTEMDYSNLVKTIDESEKIYVFGSGEVQNNAARELKRSFLAVGKLINLIEGKDEMEIMLNYITKKDVIFLISFSGETKLINWWANILKEKGIKIVTITQSGNNSLSKFGDFNIQFYTHQIATLEDELKVYSMSHFYIINEFLLAKYIEYTN